MQEHIKFLDGLINELDGSIKEALKLIKGDATELLEEEKQIVVEARKHGRESMLLSSGMISDEQYYKETYG